MLVPEILLNDNKKNRKFIKINFQNLKKKNDELQKIRQQAQSQAFRIALINKVSNIIRESMDISMILNSALKELAMMFGCFKAYYALIQQQ